MDYIRDLKRNKTLLGFVCTLILKSFLSFIDIISVNACFWTVLWLLYFTFLKDSMDMFVYIFVKYTCRLKWLYRILRIHRLLETGEVRTRRAISLSPREEMSDLLSFHQPSISKHSIKSLQSNDAMNKLTVESNISPDSSGLENFLRQPATPSARSESNYSITVPGINYNIIDETNFENVDLTYDERNETPPVSEDSFQQKPSLKRTILGWKFDKINILDSLRCNKLSSLCNAKTKWRSGAGKVAEVLTIQTEDKEKLILASEDSPEQVGCAALVSNFFKTKLQMSPTNAYSQHMNNYERF